MAERRKRRRPAAQQGGKPNRARAAKKRSQWITRIGIAILFVVVAVFFATSGGTDSSVGAVQSNRDPTIVAAGEVLYTAKCAACHGADLRGSQTGPPFLDVTYAPNHHGDEAFQQAVANGVPPHHWNFGPKAPVPDTTREEVAQIVYFIRNAQEAAGVLLDPRHA